LLCSCRDQPQQLCLSRSVETAFGLNRLPPTGPHNCCNRNDRYVTTNRCNPQNLCQTYHHYNRYNRRLSVNCLSETFYTRLRRSVPHDTPALMFSLLMTVLTNVSRIRNVTAFITPWPDDEPLQMGALVDDCGVSGVGSGWNACPYPIFWLAAKRRQHVAHGVSRGSRNVYVN